MEIVDKQENLIKIKKFDCTLKSGYTKRPDNRVKILELRVFLNFKNTLNLKDAGISKKWKDSFLFKGNLVATWDKITMAWY